MTKKKKILVTRILSQEQRDKLAAFEIDEAALISVRYIENVSIPDKVRNIVFTSKNSVIPLRENISNKQLSFERVFCVGEQTEKLLLQYGVAHVVRENSAEALAYKIIEEKIEKVDFFCGNLRREELPLILEENGIIVTEHEVYKTEFTPLKFKKHYDAILSSALLAC
ncbi:MAG: uroporphyrinogen-III synthase [Flavobacteriaceae bacterium]|nr:uroporphyrinogen-III synthase [Flavobacteriaceae bacterium]